MRWVIATACFILASCANFDCRYIEPHKNADGTLRWTSVCVPRRELEMDKVGKK